MRIAILYGDVPPGAPEDEQDVLVQVQVVSRALLCLGYEPVAVPMTLNLDEVTQRLRRAQVSLGFNLVEAVAGQGRFIHLGPALLDFLGIPHTGSGTDVMFSTSNKLLAKKILDAHKIPTPRWAPLHEPGFPGPFIIKSVWEHASIGIDDTAVVSEEHLLAAEVEKRSRDLSGPWFIEQYVEGREFNVSLLAVEGAPEMEEMPEVLPPAEILFEDFPPGKPRIVSYRAKWDATSHEYHHTPRRFDFPPQDKDLVGELTSLARKCWKIFGLRGYARVDFRVDTAGKPWVLEVNANPCLSPDSGFIAAAERAGVSLDQVVHRIISVSMSSGIARPPTLPVADSSL